MVHSPDTLRPVLRSSASEIAPCVALTPAYMQSLVISAFNILYSALETSHVATIGLKRLKTPANRYVSKQTELVRFVLVSVTKSEFVIR